jgi:uncharacterized membrane protein YbhN (UPF0104 family)
VRGDSDRRVSRRQKFFSIAFGAAVLAAIVAVVARHRDEFIAAVGSAPAWVLVVATALQLVALVSRTEAWHVCIGAAGGSVARRALYRAAGFGYLGSQLNAQVGTAARIAVLRKAHPDESPRVPALIAAEAPIVMVEAGFGALAFFTLIGPLGLPWWAPLAALGVVGVVWLLLDKVSRAQGDGWRTGLAVLGQRRGRILTIAIMSVAIGSQIVRNWLMLRAVGVEASFLDATAVLVAMAVIAQLPVGPSVGAAAVVLILGSGGVAAAAAAGVLLTATGAAGAVIYVAWAVLDGAWVRRRAAAPIPADGSVERSGRAREAAIPVGSSRDDGSRGREDERRDRWEPADGRVATAARA